MAESPDLIHLFVVPLNELGIPYMVTGAVAAVVYGEPRFTRDVDLVMAIAPGDADRLATAFPTDTFYVPPIETIAEEARRPAGGQFNLIHHDTALKADCYPVGEDALHLWAMDRRVQHDVGDTSISVAPIEYVILRKLEWYRDGGADRHFDDIRSMLRVSGDTVDLSELAGWIDRLDLDAEWQHVTRS